MFEKERRKAIREEKRRIDPQSVNPFG